MRLNAKRALHATRHPFEREIAIQACCLGILLWGATAVVYGTRIWTQSDFVHFYTLARLARAGHADLFTEAAAQYRAQVSVLPASTQMHFQTGGYSPHVAVMLMPLGYISFESARVIWTVLTIITYLLTVSTVANRMVEVRPYRNTVVIVALAFPPFWWLVQAGHLSVVATVSVALAWESVRRGNSLLAGASIGLLAYKPTLFVPALAIVCLARDWPVVVSSCAMAITQVCMGAMVAKVSAGQLAMFIYDGVTRLNATSNVHISLMYSWRAFWLVLFGYNYVAQAAYVVCAVASAIIAAHAWRRSERPDARIAALTLGIVLISPHMYVYDLTFTAIALLCVVNLYRLLASRSNVVVAAIYGGVLLPIAPVFAKVVHLQVATLCYAIMLMWCDSTSHRGCGIRAVR